MSSDEKRLGPMARLEKNMSDAAWVRDASAAMRVSSEIIARELRVSTRKVRKVGNLTVERSSDLHSLVEFGGAIIDVTKSRKRIGKQAGNAALVVARGEAIDFVELGPIGGRNGRRESPFSERLEHAIEGATGDTSAATIEGLLRSDPNFSSERKLARDYDRLYTFLST